MGVCIALSLAYSIGSWLAAWVVGAPGGLGDVTLMEQGDVPDWMPAATPPWLPRLVVALLLVGITVFFWWCFRTLSCHGWRNSANG